MTAPYDNNHFAEFALLGNSVQNAPAAATAVSAKDILPAASENSPSPDTGLISDLGLILVVAAVTTVLFKRLSQPVVLGYILAGFLVGPHFGYFPTVVDETNIDFWAELGIIFLLFSLGLTFSFKKLANTGGSAVTTALVIVIGMMATGFCAGRIMGFSSVSSLFLGGMLSMSSTTIIMKAFDDLNMRHRKFTSQVLAVLIVEDLFAVVLLVVLSSIAVNNSVSGSELLWSICKLLFFLIFWFLVGVYAIPSFLSRQRKYLTDELLLVFSIGLCFMMVIFSEYSGFSSALGAFVMGSILAGTSAAERISKVVSPVKDLFGAIFFVSVGMMVDPHIIADYTSPILILSLVVIVGMIVFGTFGMLLTGQSLRIAIESGFSLTQIGEFSFIIATLGTSLGVLDAELYPIIVSVSVITTFFTPYFIKFSDPFSKWIEQHIPTRLLELLNRYNSSISRNESEVAMLWKKVLGRSLWRIMLYSVLLTAIILISKQVLFPLLTDSMGNTWGKTIATTVTLIIMSPFLLALCYPGTKRWEREKLQSSVRSNAPFIAMRSVRIMIAFGFLLFFLITSYSHTLALTVSIALFLFIAIYFSKSVRKHMRHIESVFIDNLNERELRRSGKNNNLVSDMHLAYINIGSNCPFVGERIADTGFGKKFGINIVSIQRGETNIPIPTGKMRIFPDDTLGIIGTDEQIQQLITVVEQSAESKMPQGQEIDMDFTSITVSEHSPMAGKSIADLRLRENYTAMIVAIEKKDNTFEKPTAGSVIEIGDNVWLVGDKKKLKMLI